jgi:hypothetical protein
MDMQRDRRRDAGAVLKAFLAAAVAAAVAIGLALPVPHRHDRPPPSKSQFATFEVGGG